MHQAPAGGSPRSGADALVMSRRLRVAAAVLCLAGILGIPAAADAASRPVATSLTVWPRAVTAGQAPAISLKIVEPGVRTVRARLVVLSQPRQDPVARIDLGAVRTGRRMTAAWPQGVALPAGRYLVRVHAQDAQGHTLVRRAHTSGRLIFTVNPGRPRRRLLSAYVFPVAGPHTTWPAGSDGSFGAGRVGHQHEGQDIAAAAGTPVVAPVGGTVTAVRYQAGGAGWYVVARRHRRARLLLRALHGGVGRRRGGHARGRRHAAVRRRDDRLGHRPASALRDLDGRLARPGRVSDRSAARPARLGRLVVRPDARAECFTPSTVC